jgi:hypothetical protein
MKSTTNLIKASCAALLAFALVGCAAKMSSEERLALKRVSIGAIEMPETPFVAPPGSGTTFALTGPVGVALSQGDLPKAYKSHLAKNNINVAANIRTELASQLKSKGIEVVEADKASAVLTVQVLQYGLTVSDSFFTPDRFPQLRLKMNLKKPNGDVIWSDFASADVIQGITKQVEPRPLPDFFNDPRLLQREITKVTAIVIAAATKSL